MAILSIGELLGMGPSELSGLIPYSGLEYSGTAITGISGSAIGGVGGVPESSVSAIASAYAESAASSKVDQSAFDNCCSAVNDALSGISGAVSGVTGQTGNYIDWSSSGVFQPSGDYAYNSALSGKLDNSASSTWYPMTGNPSGFLTEHQSLSGYATEAYVDSSVSGKQDASGMSAYATTGDLRSKLDVSAVNFDGDSSHVTGISGVPLSAQGGGGGDYVEKSALEVTIGSANTARGTAVAQGRYNFASSMSFAQGYSNGASSNSFAQGYGNGASSNSFAQGDGNVASSNSLAQGQYNKASSYSFAQGEFNSASSYSFAQGERNRASSYSFVQGQHNSANNTAAVFGQYNLHGNGSTTTGDSAAFVIGDGTSNNARHDLMLVTKNGEITMYSSTADKAGFGIVSSIKAISGAAGGNKLDVSSVNFNWDSSYVTSISGIPFSAVAAETPMIPLTSTDGSVIITNQGTYADVIVTGTTGDLTVSGISILGLYRWATSQGYRP